MTSLLLPKWSSDLKYGPCPPARDFGSRVSGLVNDYLSCFNQQQYQNNGLEDQGLQQQGEYCWTNIRSFSYVMIIYLVLTNSNIETTGWKIMVDNYPGNIAEQMYGLSVICNDREKSRSQSSTFWLFSRETGFSFSYEKVECLDWPNVASDEIDRVSKFDNSLSFGAKQKSLGQIFFGLLFFKDFFAKNPNWIFYVFFMISSRINKGVYLYLFEHTNTRKYLNCIAAHLWGYFWVFYLI